MRAHSHTSAHRRYASAPFQCCTAYDRARPVLEDINFELPRGSRCLLVGDNGAGKTTLLKILAGRHMTAKEETVMVLGRSAARDGSLNHLRSYLGGDWGKTTVRYAER